MTNSVGSRYIGTIGTSGSSPGGMHAHIAYFVDRRAMDDIRAQKVGLKEVYNPKYYLDMRTLVNKS